MGFCGTQVYKMNCLKIITMHREWHLVIIFGMASMLTQLHNQDFLGDKTPTSQCFLSTYRLMTVPM